MYKWSNKKKLYKLRVSGKNKILRFQAGSERAEVHLGVNGIKKVVFTDSSKGKTVTINKSAKHIVVGNGNTKRDVFHYLIPGGPAPTMRLGITKHIGRGTWSSLPHTFELKTEPGFEEIFFHILEGGTKRAFQVGRGVWCDNSRIDDIWTVYDHTFSTIPMGYHPVVGEPEVQVSYIWVYLAKHKRWEKI